ncbi:MAG: 4-(cytidine 5'-diphospho)-2-C-methyl-D-erythritol kinase [Abditibacteriota bacterium]|nr:4-(cytidine 5'-diphospho)-2-C-methyl-D-erythritol kinase [Abditibacteriota bacterium]
MEIKAFAKVNLTLEVGERRPDGYHSLRSITACVSLCDRLTVTLKEGGKIDLDCSDGSIPTETNTAYRAALAFRDAFCPGLGAEIRLQKHIPSQAGLGGGSSDASAVLLALNRLCGSPASPRELAALGAGLGSDMPLFIYGGICLMEGRGEKITPLPDSFPMDLILLKPGTGVSTREAYAMLDRRGTAGSLTSPRSLPGSREEYYKIACNSFEEPAAALNGEVPLAAAHLKAAGAEFTLLCGSGSAVMGVYEDPAARDRALEQLLRATDMQALPCRIMTREEYAREMFGDITIL